MSIEDALEKIIAQADNLISRAEQNAADTTATKTSGGEEMFTDILPGFPEKDDVSVEKMVEAWMENYDKAFRDIARAGDILVSGFNFGFVWDVRRSKVTVTEGEGGRTWSQKVAELPPNVQEIITGGGLEKWVKQETSSSA
ncbi:hypothetical protein DL769_006292 [Monosporascus sp. CRB-8-3]|nr:hypothetical protein DL769_006292 [Monosporascus sp. CRB-8-3]